MALALFSLMLALVLADVGVRVAGIGGRVYEPRRFEPDGRVPFVQIPRGPIAYRPGANFSSVYDMTGLPGGESAGKIRYTINAMGFRGPEVSASKPEGIVRVACLGDSITFGEGVKEPECYPRRLEAILNAGGESPRYEVLNCGVQGHGTIDEYVYYTVHVSKLDPDLVTLGFFLNDAMDGAETIRRNEEMTRAWKISPFSRVSRISEILERGRIARRMQADYFSSIRESFKSKRWADSQRAIGDLRRSVERGGGRLAVVVFPVLWALDSEYPFEAEHRLIADAMAKEGVACFDLLSQLRGRAASTLWVHPTDHHPNEIVQEMAAVALAKWIEAGQ